MKNYLDGGDAVLEAIRKLGIDHIISSPGSEWAPVWEAMARQDHDKADGPNFIDTWHETLAVDMAIGYSLITGRGQAVLLHAGAGLLQGSMGILGARHWEVPMLVLSGESVTYGEDPDLDPGQQWARNLSIVGGPHRLIEPVVKYASQATSPKTLFEMVVRAGEMAARPPKGPTYLNVPLEHLLAEWSPPEIGRNVPPAPKTISPDADIEAVAEALAAAKNPVIVSEYGGRDAATFNAMIELAEAVAIPVYDGEASVCANFPKNHPLYQGTDMSAVKDDADLVLMVRCRAPWYPAARRPKHAHLVAIDENPHQSHMVYQALQADSYLEGDAATSLSRLAEAVTAGGGGTGVEDRRAASSAAHQAMDAKNHALRQDTSAKSPIDPLWLCAAIGDTMPADTIYIDELTLHSGMARTHVPWSQAQSYYGGRGGLGQGLGLSLGIKLASPERPVVALMGDGGFLYNPVVQSLGAARDSGLPVLIIIFNNKKYAAMRGGYSRYYADGVAVTDDNLRGVHINGPDYAELAPLFDGHGERIEDPAELHGALERALAAVRGGQFAILNVVVSR
jgi:acetolactate synthase-1/2/3 large subunit